jgi:hypothetical protein
MVNVAHQTQQNFSSSTSCDLTSSSSSSSPEDLLQQFELQIMNSSTYFDNRIEIEQESDILIADHSFDECNYFKDDDICA